MTKKKCSYDNRFEDKVEETLALLVAERVVLRFVRTQHCSKLDIQGVDFEVWLPGNIYRQLQVKSSCTNGSHKYNTRLLKGDVSRDIRKFCLSPWEPADITRTRLVFLLYAQTYEPLGQSLLMERTTAVSYLLIEAQKAGHITSFVYNPRGYWHIATTKGDVIVAPPLDERYVAQAKDYFGFQLKTIVFWQLRTFQNAIATL